MTDRLLHHTPTIFALAAIMTIGLHGHALARNTTSLILQYDGVSDSDICPQLIHIVEQKRLIPHQLLLSVATVESTKPETRKPWPWTINVGGTGEVFDNAHQAIARVKHLLAQGKRNIDIGCMQINYMYHHASFTSLETMFDPVHNVAFATTFLLSLFERHGSWSDAVRHYHSANPEKHQRYHENVMAAWDRVSPPATNDRGGGSVINRENPAQVRSAPMSRDDLAIRALIEDTQLRYQLSHSE